MRHLVLGAGQVGTAVAEVLMRIGQYYRDIIGWRTWYTHPSLADHRDTGSLVGHGQGGNRRAHTHHPGSALDIDGRGP